MKLWLLEEFSFSALKGMYWENYGEYELWCKAHGVKG